MKASDWLEDVDLEGSDRVSDVAPSCAVCYEDLGVVGGPVALPCSCQASYCRSCWDRALNASFDQSKMAQCPTCRCSIRVDFDETSGYLKFALQEDSKPDVYMRQRLQEQTKPFQIRLLERSRNQREDSPLCVCGCRLVRISVRHRVLGFVAECLGVPAADAEKHDRVADLAGKFLNGYHEVPITCDICQSLSGPQRLSANAFVWTCQAGNKTLLHGRSYDVCDECFDLFTGIVDAMDTT